MCGIAGIYDKNGVAKTDAVLMSCILQHRGPDDEGFLLANEDAVKTFRGNDTLKTLSNIEHIEESDFQANLILLHRRLSIIDVSANGHQPMCTENENFSIVFNGEIYNYKEIRSVLQQKGYVFQSESDTEVVLNAFIEWGAACVNQFVGMWAFAIYQHKEKKLLLSRDRFGIKPIYLYHHNDFFAFASEIKALLPLTKVDKSISEENLGSYLAYGTTHQPYQNLYKNIIDLEPGCNYEIDLSDLSIKKQNYFSLDTVVKPLTNTQNLTQQFEELFNDSIALHLRSDVEIGSCLSGGLDSSAIVHYASQQLGDKKMQTFTAAYKNKTVDESNYAKIVANSLQNVTDHYTYPNAATFLKDLDKIIYHQDLPIGSTSIFAQWEVMKCANQHQVKVLLDGQGADEILGGYYNFAGLQLIELLKKMKFIQFFKQYYLLRKNFTPAVKMAVLRAAYYYLPEKLQQKLRATERHSYAFIKETSLKDLSLEVPKRGGKTFSKHSDLSMQFGMYELLRYEDRNSMAFSIESRVPFLDHRLVNFIRALPTNEKINGGWTKLILRKILDNKLPHEIVWRKDKKGFVTPQQEWKNEMMDTLTKELKELKTPEIVDRDYLLKLCNQDFSNATHLSEFWRVYSVVKWYNNITPL